MSKIVLAVMMLLPLGVLALVANAIGGSPSPADRASVASGPLATATPFQLPPTSTPTLRPMVPTWTPVPTVDAANMATPTPGEEPVQIAGAGTGSGAGTGPPAGAAAGAAQAQAAPPAASAGSSGSTGAQSAASAPIPPQDTGPALAAEEQTAPVAAQPDQQDAPAPPAPPPPPSAPAVAQPAPTAAAPAPIPAPQQKPGKAPKPKKGR